MQADLPFPHGATMRFFNGKFIVIVILLLAIAGAPFLFAEESAKAAAEHGSSATTFLWIAIILLAAKISGLVERFGQPSVLGELVMGVLLGNLVLVGITIFEPVKSDIIIRFLAELGVVVLLFQIGLESNITKMRSVGMSAFFVAIVGIIAPFLLGTYLVGPLLLPGLSSNAYLFLGAALTATSVGITARVFRDLGKLQDREAQIILGAAVIDDVLGLVLLAVISALATIGVVTFSGVGLIVAKAALFLAAAVFLGQLLAEQLGKLFSYIHTGTGMKFTLALSFGLIFAFLAHVIGLAPIVGAFAAGLILDPVHFRFFRNPHIVEEIEECMHDSKDEACRKRVGEVITSHAKKHMEDLLEPVSFLLVPLFFVVTGMDVNLSVLLNGHVLFVALGITIVAFLGKIVAGLAAGKNVNRSLIGWGMVPRGEVGLIFATIGRSLGVVSEEVFSVIVIMVILTTLLTPPVLTFILKREEHRNTNAKHVPAPIPAH
jgi:Kef-type K+ transport system membrane component KefB